LNNNRLTYVNIEIGTNHYIYIRCNIGEKRTFKATRVKLEDGQFTDGRVVNHPRAKDLNKMIREAIHDIEAKEFKEHKKYPDSDYRTYLELCLSRWADEKKKVTLTQYRTYNEQFLEWNGETPLSKVTVDKLNAYKAHLNKTYKGSNNVWKALTRIKTIFGQAKRENVIEATPFDLVEIPVYKQGRRDYLIQEEVDRIEDYTFSKQCPDVLKFYAVWFLIGCYTGLRFSDMQQFNREEHIKGGRLVLYTLKTGDLVSIPFNQKLKTFLEAVSYRPMEYSNQKFNENLKYLMAACEIDTKLTVHLSRHTFAVRCANAGIPIEVTAKLLAQTDTKSTAIYYKITDMKVDAEFNKLF
jgi:integrase/recombinase XerD